MANPLKQPNFTIPTNFEINKEEKEETNNDRACIVENVKRLLHDLFEVAAFDRVALGLNPRWTKGGTTKWGADYLRMVQVQPEIEMTRPLKKQLNYDKLSAYTTGWPAHWMICERYLGAGNGSTDFYLGNRNIPDFLIGVYHKDSWEEEYDRRLDKALFTAMTEGKEL